MVIDGLLFPFKSEFIYISDYILMLFIKLANMSDHGVGNYSAKTGLLMGVR